MRPGDHEMKRTETWLIVNVCDSILNDKPLGDGVEMNFSVSPRRMVTRELRPIAEVEELARKAGFEVKFASMPRPGLPPWEWDKVELAILAKLREELKLNVRTHAVSIEATHNFIKYSE
jgi:hypothetical protein